MLICFKIWYFNKDSVILVLKEDQPTMKIVSIPGQLTFDEMKGSLEGLPKTNRWVVLGDTLPWGAFEALYSKRLNNEKSGADNVPARTVISALIIKHRQNLSDRETIQIIQENPYMQYMCGLAEYTDQPIFDPSLFVTIRKRITIEDINTMTLEVARKAGKKDDGDGGGKGDGGANGMVDKTLPSDLKADATCADAEVRYPTDIDCIEDGSKYIDRMIDKVCGLKGMRKPAAVERGRIRSISSSGTRYTSAGTTARYSRKRRFRSWVDPSAALRRTPQPSSGSGSGSESRSETRPRSSSGHPRGHTGQTTYGQSSRTPRNAGRECATLSRT